MDGGIRTIVEVLVLNSLVVSGFYFCVVQTDRGKTVRVAPGLEILKRDQKFAMSFYSLLQCTNT